jgi:hypothetical protein
MKGKITTSIPKGLKPKGSTRPIRDQPNQRSATDTPIEVPIYVNYERHTTSGDRALLGWTIQNDCWAFATKVDIKICRNPRRLEVWINGKKVHTTTSLPGERKVPLTAPEEEEDYSSIEEWFGDVDWESEEGWATKLGKKHAGIKRTDQRLNGTHDIVEPKKIDRFDDEIIDDDEEIEWED